MWGLRPQVLSSWEFSSLDSFRVNASRGMHRTGHIQFITLEPLLRPPRSQAGSSTTVAEVLDRLDTRQIGSPTGPNARREGKLERVGYRVATFSRNCRQGRFLLCNPNRDDTAPTCASPRASRRWSL